MIQDLYRIRYCIVYGAISGNTPFSINSGFTTHLDQCLDSCLTHPEDGSFAIEKYFLIVFCVLAHFKSLHSHIG